jgi:hypothetical protein
MEHRHRDIACNQPGTRWFHRSLCRKNADGEGTLSTGRSGEAEEALPCQDVLALANVFDLWRQNKDLECVEKKKNCVHPPITLWICLEAKRRLHLALSRSRDWHGRVTILRDSHLPKGPPLCAVGDGVIVHYQSHLTDLALKEAS